MKAAISVKILIICALPSYEKRPMMLLNSYGVEMGTSGLIIQAQSREEIYADKLIAFALRSNRVKYRDLWDIGWLHGLGIKPRLELIPKKLMDRGCERMIFLNLFDKRLEMIRENPQMAVEFQQEMQRFLPVQEQDNWAYIVYLMEDLRRMFPI